MPVEQFRYTASHIRCRLSSQFGEEVPCPTGHFRVRTLAGDAERRLGLPSSFEERAARLLAHREIHVAELADRLGDVIILLGRSTRERGEEAEGEQTRDKPR